MEYGQVFLFWKRKKNFQTLKHTKKVCENTIKLVTKLEIIIKHIKVDKNVTIFLLQLYESFGGKRG